jgi:hypothetical protein
MRPVSQRHTIQKKQTGTGHNSKTEMKRKGNEGILVVISFHGTFGVGLVIFPTEGFLRRFAIII